LSATKRSATAFMDGAAIPQYGHVKLPNSTTVRAWLDQTAESVVSLRLGRVMGVELSEDTFDPAELMADWKKKPEWNVAREW